LSSAMATAPMWPGREVIQMVYETNGNQKRMQ
jgi:hypothetical protein